MGCGPSTNGQVWAEPMEVTHFKDVPNSIEDITASWCQTALQKGSAIDKDTTVIKVEIKPLINEASGLEDGGGLSPFSNIVKLIPTYG